MNNEIKTGRGKNDLHTSRAAFWMIRIMHDNPLLTLIKNPYHLLAAAGLKPGQKVLEVGCGPGFFTIPAAKIIGENGMCYAVDVNPRAVKRVEEKMKRAGMTNIRTITGNAAECGLHDGSIDLAFVFGLRYIAGGLDNLVTAMHHIIKAGGVLAFEKTCGSDEKLVEEVERDGFTKTAVKGRVFIFTRGENT